MWPYNKMVRNRFLHDKSYKLEFSFGILSLIGAFFLFLYFEANFKFRNNFTIKLYTLFKATYFRS